MSSSRSNTGHILERPVEGASFATRKRARSMQFAAIHWNLRQFNDCQSMALRILLFSMTLQAWLAPTRAQDASKLKPLAEIQSTDITESSGLAVSGVNPEIFWTHNDSGGDLTLYAFDRTGKIVGRSPVRNAECRDWEDMGSFTIQGQHYLFIADTGDNSLKHHTYTIYWGVEPQQPGQPITMQLLRFRYEDEPHDCEAVAFDPVHRQFLLIEKRIHFNSRVYQVAWKPLAEARVVEVAKRIGTVPVTMATGADITSDGRRLVVGTYGNGYEAARAEDQEWQQALRKPGQSVTLPLRRQGEAICYGSDDQTLFLTSEKRPCPLFSITRSMPDNDAARK